jgi:uncharacterized membrane protein YeaQ/YmgE (transglycosylase-associated protein family)
MRLRVEAGRARTRTSVKVIVGATGALVAGLALLDRGYLAPYDTATGQLVLALVGAVFLTAFTWLARMTRSVSVERSSPRAMSSAILKGRPHGIQGWSGRDACGSILGFDEPIRVSLLCAASGWALG